MHVGFMVWQLQHVLWLPPEDDARPGTLDDVLQRSTG